MAAFGARWPCYRALEYSIVAPIQRTAERGPPQSLDKPQVSYLNTYPSYLGELVERGLRQGYRPSDFGLERIGGGELVSEGLKERTRRLFGSVGFDEGHGMTET